MKARHCLPILIYGIALNLLGCGSPMYPMSSAPPAPVEDTSANRYLPGLEVRGSAAFGAHCNYGTYEAPVPAPLELYNCPIGISELELEKQLPALIFQIDCKKRTIDVRGTTLDSKMTTWEFLPDGHFWFSVDGGYAQLKDDGSGNKDCVTPLVAELWGNIDCTDMDKAKIHVETVWWMDKTYSTLIGAPAPVPSTVPGPSASPNSTPTPTPGSTPTSTPVPSPTPASSPTSSPTSTMSPSPSPSPSPTMTPTEVPSPTPSTSPFAYPSSYPSEMPTALPSAFPTLFPQPTPSSEHSSPPEFRPWFFSVRVSRSTAVPSAGPSSSPSSSPSGAPSGPSFPGSTATPSSSMPTGYPRCKLPVSYSPNAPSGCYLHNVSRFKVCS